MADAPRNMFRVTREFHGPRLTGSQQRVLAAVVALCPETGSAADGRSIARTADARLGSVVLVLRALEQQRLVMLHPGEDGEPDCWTPTMTGRSRVRHFPDAPKDRKTQTDRAD